MTNFHMNYWTSLHRECEVLVLLRVCGNANITVDLYLVDYMYD